MSIKDKLKLPDSVHDHVVKQLMGKDWSEIEELEEHAGYLLFPAEIYKRNKKGDFDGTPIMIRVPRQHEMRQARVEARAKANKEGLDPVLDKDQIDDLENICILWRAIRMPTDPFDPLVLTSEELEKTYDRRSLAQIYAKMDAYNQVLDPQPNQVSQEEIFALIAVLAKEKNLLPLHVYGSEAQTTCVIFMAEQLMNSADLKS
jgi:hypothetical protein